MPEQSSKYANFGEEAIIRKYTAQFGVDKGYAVDIGASNGRCSSNTLSLFEDGWSGLCIEYDPQKFVFLSDNYKSLPDVVLCKTKITPDNVSGILQAFCRAGIDFLNIDIDGYDYHVLNSLLKKYRPKLISVEINQNIPPPVMFTVDYFPGYWWASDGFFGMSLSQVEYLCKLHYYCIVEVEYNNAFIVPAELNKTPVKSIDRLYHDGFFDRSDCRDKLVSDWSMINALMTMPNNEKIEYINQVFSQHKGKFTCQI